MLFRELKLRLSCVWQSPPHQIIDVAYWILFHPSTFSRSARGAEALSFSTTAIFIAPPS